MVARIASGSCSQAFGLENRVGRTLTNQFRENVVLFEKLKRAIHDIRQGKMVILVDDEERENEGDLCMAAEFVTPEAVNFMAKYGRGLICVALTEEKIRELDLPMMVSHNTSSYKTGFTVSIEARRGVTTGISAADRAKTILTAIHKDTRPEDLARPGHVFPLRALKGGVLVRTGQTEGSVDLAKLAGCNPAGVICEIMNEDGSMSRMPDLEKFATQHNFPIVSIADIVKYRMQHESLVYREMETEIDTNWGPFRAIAYSANVDSDKRQHLCLAKGDIQENEPVLVRVHKECVLGDVFGSCGCGNLLRGSMEKITQEGKGIIVYLNQLSSQFTNLSETLRNKNCQKARIRQAPIDLDQDEPEDDNVED